jgi:predicted nucleotidyltransferase
MLNPVVCEPDTSEIVRRLRSAGARFAFLHGSRAAGTARSDSDVDVAAWFGAGAPAAYEVDVPAGVDLCVLDSAGLELAGRVAQHGKLLFEDDPAARVTWQAQTRLMYLDEELRQRKLDQVFFEEHGRGR